MTVYILNIFLILIWGFVLTYINPTRRKKAAFCTIASFQWILLSGLRHPSVGPDTENYMYSFSASGRFSWQELFNAFFRFYFKNEEKIVLSDGTALSKDVGFTLFEKLIHVFTDNPQVYLFIVAVVIFSSLGYFIYKNADDPCFAYILFSTLFYSFFAITGLRQAIATALGVFIGYEFIKQRKLWKFLLVILIAFTIHKSVLVFLPFYFLARLKISWKYFTAVIAATAAMLLGGAPLILQLGELFGYDREEVYEANTTTYTLLMLLIGAATIFLYRYIQKQGAYKNTEINAAVLSSALTLLTTVDQAMMRVQQYYALFLMFGIPNIYNSLDKKIKPIVRIAGVGGLLLLFIRTHPTYMFYWQ